MASDSTNGTGGAPAQPGGADAASAEPVEPTQVAEGATQPVVIAHQIAQGGIGQVPLLAMMPQAGEWVVIKVEPGSAVQLPVDVAQFTGHEVRGNLELTLPNGGVVVLEGFSAATDSGTPPELLSAEGKPFDLAEFLVAIGVAPEVVRVTQPPPQAPVDHGGHFTSGPGPQTLGDLTPTGALAGTELAFPGLASIEQTQAAFHRQEETPRALEFAISSSTVSEGQVAVFTVSYTGDTLAPGQTATIHVQTGPGFTAAFPDAASGADYTPFSTDLTFTGGQPTAQTVAVQTVDDTVVESPEDFTVVLSSPSQGTIAVNPGNGVILDDDGARLNWSIITDSTIAEGASASYTVGYTGAPLATGITETITVLTGAGWNAGMSDALVGADFATVSTVLTFTGGQATAQTVSVATINDTIVEGPEDYTISIANPSQGTISHSPANGVITDNDGANLNWSIIADSTVAEGNSATYTVGYTGAPLATGIAETITVLTGSGWNAGMSDALPGADYATVSTVLTFTGGQTTTQTVSVTTVDDTIVEGPEDYTISIANPSQGTIGHSPANGVITDNDGNNLNWSIVMDSTVAEGVSAAYTVGYTGAPLATGIAEAQDIFVNNERKIGEETRVSWNSVQTSHQNVATLQRTVLANTQTRDAYRQQFDIGQRGLLDLLNSDNELYLSQDNLITATYAEMFARYRLLAVAGGLEKALAVNPPDQSAVPVEQ